MALAAFCHAERSDQGWMKDQGEARNGLDLASRAVELAKDDANVIWMAAYAILRLQMDQPRARELVRHSLELNRNSAIACALAGVIEANLGNTDEALELLLRAERLSPRDPRGWFIPSKLAWVYFIEGRFEDAISAAKKALNQNPRCALALRFLAASLAGQGRLKDAAQVIREVLRIEPHLTLTKLRARLMFIEDKIWRRYSAALHKGGLPQ